MIKGLYGIVDNSFSLEYSHFELAKFFLAGGCRILQLRMKEVVSRLKSAPPKGLGSRTLVRQWNDKVFETAKEIIKLKNDYDFTFIINDYVDVAGEVGADGLHVGANDISIEDARKRLPGKLIGYSSHSIDEALSAEKQGADYIAFGAIFPTKTKGPGHPVQGTDKLKELVAKINKPIIAIGGINRMNITNVLNTGVSSVAMITALTLASDIAKETKFFVELCQRF